MAPVILERLRIKNFRSLHNVDLLVGDDIVLLGQNNAGKSSVIRAMEILFGNTEITEEDFPLAGTARDPQSPDKWVTIEGTFRLTARSWNALFLGHLYHKGDRDYFTIRFQYRHSEEEEAFVPITHFVVPERPEDPQRDALTGRHRRALRLFVISAQRDLVGELRSGGRGFWGRLLRDVDLSDQATAINEAFQAAGSALESHPQFSKIAEEFGDAIQSIVAPGSKPNVTFGFGVTSTRNVLKQLSLLVSGMGNEGQLGIESYGVGTQNAMAMAVFKAFVGAMQESGTSAVIVAVEEPEAHLHPHSQRALVEYLKTLGSQVILTTHSTAVANAAGVERLAVVRKSGAHSGIRQIDPENSKLQRAEILSLDRVLRVDRSEMLFSRAVILVEGETEEYALSRFAEMLGYDLHAGGISIQNIRGQQFFPYMLLLSGDAFDIPTVVVADDEPSLERRVAVFCKYLKNLGLAVKSSQDDVASVRTEIEEEYGIFVVEGAFERAMFRAGAYEEYVAVVKELDEHRFQAWVRSGRLLVGDHDSLVEFIDNKMKVTACMGVLNNLNADKIPVEYQRALAAAVARAGA